MTPAEKAIATKTERKQREQEESAARKNDRVRAVEVCRQIRDDESAANADRLKAIELLYSLTA